MLPTKFVPKYQRKPDLQVVDEFFVNKNKLQLVARFKEKVERMYQIEMTFGDKVEDGQWLILKGVPVDRRNAKNYITALCDPDERQEIQFTSTACVDFMDEETLEHIERQTNAVIKPLKNIAEFEICGTDLAVTLAMSLMEEMACMKESPGVGEESVDEGNASVILISPSTQAGAHRLSSTLERALSQHSDGVCNVDDYKETPNAVKRVLVNCLADTTADDMDDDMLFSGGAGPGVITIKDNASRKPSSTAEIEIDGETPKMEIEKRTSPGLSEKLSEALTTGPAAPPVISKQQEYLRNFGASVGYSKDEVAEALMFVDEKTRPSDFLDLLNTVKQKSDIDQSTDLEPDVVILETETIDLTDVSSTVAEDIPKAGSSAHGSTDQSSFATDLPDKYKARLLMDFFQEDDNCSVEELKRRNRERQKLLKLNFQQQQTGESGQTHSPKKTQAAIAYSDSPGKKKGQTKQSKKQKREDAKTSACDSKTYGQDDDQTCVLTPWQQGDVVAAGQTATNTSQPPGDWTTPKRKQSKGQVAAKTNAAAPAATTYQQQQFPVQSQDNLRVKPTQVVTPSNLPAEQSRWQTQMTVPPPMAIPHPDELRYIIIDGSNVAMTHGNGKYFSCKGLQICVDYFKQRGHTKITIFVPHWRRARPRDENPIMDQDILDKLKDEDYLVFTPSRRIGRRLVAAYDDRFVLELAEAEEGIIVSNDQYRDLMLEKASWRTVIEDRLLMYSFVKDRFMPPNDPLGRDGPCLDDFLRKQPKQRYPGVPRPYGPSSNYQGSQTNYLKGPGQTQPFNPWQCQSQFVPYNPAPGYIQPAATHQRSAPVPGLFSHTVADGANRQPHGDGANRQPLGDGANRQPLGDGANRQPHGDGANRLPHGDGANRQPLGDGANRQPLGDGANRQLFGDSASRQPYCDGANRQPQRPIRTQGPQRRDVPRVQQPAGQGHKWQVRSEEATDNLYRELKTIFPEDEQEATLRQVLTNHECETDLTKLTNYCISVLFG